MAGMKGISRVLGRVRGSRGGLDMAGLTGGGMGMGMDMMIIMMGLMMMCMMSITDMEHVVGMAGLVVVATEVMEGTTSLS